MRYSSVLSFGLLAVPSVFATVHDITVGSSSGALEFSPDAIVSAALFSREKRRLSAYFSPLNLEIKSFSILSRRTTLLPNPLSMTHVVHSKAVSTRACENQFFILAHISSNAYNRKACRLLRTSQTTSRRTRSASTIPSRCGCTVRMLP